MSYNQQTEVTPVYWTKYASIYGDAYLNMWNQLACIKDENARASAVNGYMISFARAMGMQELGTATMDDSNADAPVTSFVKSVVGKTAPADTGMTNMPAPPKAPSGSYGGQPNAEKKPYVSNGQPLQGSASEKQLSTLERFRDGKNTEVKSVLFSELGKLGRADVSELSKQEASVLIDKCFKIVNDQKAAKGE